MSKKVFALMLVVVLVLSVALVGCGKKEPAPAPKMKVGIVYDVGGRGDKSFNDTAYAGLERAGTDFADKIEIKDLEPAKDGSNREDLLRSLGQQGYDLIFGVGFLFADAMEKVAKEFPNTKFGIIDGYIANLTPESNVVCLGFAEHEGSFLVGAAAALATTKNHVGFVGGMEIDLIKKFEAGFKAGALYINPNIKISSQYIGTDGSAFANPERGKEIALSFIEKGADVIYHASGASGAGVIAAAAEKGVLAIGVDADQSLTVDDDAQRARILTSMLKKVDVAVYDTIKALIEGNFQGGYQSFDLKANGVGYAVNQYNTNLLTEAMRTKLDELKTKIINGELVVPATYAELDTFKANLGK
ncbi:MAG: BMP family ABC transporter substrate-binding protein [Bacillota bacterium]